jgi:hypothetical protein
MQRQPAVAAEREVFLLAEAAVHQAKRVGCNVGAGETISHLALSRRLQD